MTVFGDQPTGGLGQTNDLQNQQNGKDSLKGKGKAVLKRRRVRRRTKVGPVRNNNAQNSHRALQRQECATDIRRRTFTLVNRRGGRVHAVAKTRDDTAHEELCDGVGRRENSGADDHDGAACDEHGASAKAFADKVDEDRAEDAANVVEARDVALHGGLGVVEVGSEAVVGADDARHYAWKLIGVSDTMHTQS